MEQNFDVHKVVSRMKASLQKFRPPMVLLKFVEVHQMRIGYAYYYFLISSKF